MLSPAAILLSVHRSFQRAQNDEGPRKKNDIATQPLALHFCLALNERRDAYHYSREPAGRMRTIVGHVLTGPDAWNGQGRLDMFFDDIFPTRGKGRRRTCH